jgi:hypothetical protein
LQPQKSVYLPLSLWQVLIQHYNNQSVRINDD